MAGYWGSAEAKNGRLDDKVHALREYSITATADAADASFGAEKEIPDITGLLVGVALEFGSTPPDNVDLLVKNRDGTNLIGTDGADVTASTIISVSPAMPFVGGLTLAVSDNTTNSAEVTIRLYVL